MVALCLLITGCSTTVEKIVDLEITTISGTIAQGNYDKYPPKFMSILLPGATDSHAVLFLGFKGEQDGNFLNYGWSYIVYGAGNYYLLVHDENKWNLGKDYLIKYIK